MGVRVLLGPPGTGKTTTLLNRIEGLIESGVAPSYIAFVSFTKAACNEARERACDRFCLEDEDLPFFRTIHSLAFKLCGGRSLGEVMKDKHWKEFGEACRYSFSSEGQADTPFFSSFVTDGDQLRQIYDLSRLCMCSVERAMLRVGARELRVTAEHVRAYGERLQNFKREHNYVDFTDMLERALRSPSKPSVDRAFVDEAQDLCPLQHALVRHWFIQSMTCTETTLAGDDDQAIFTWAGADPDSLIRAAREHSTEVLDRSWRVPAGAHALAMRIVGQNKNRIEKTYRPRDDKGIIAVVRNVEEGLSNLQGPTLALVRNIAFAESMAEAALDQGRIFSSEVGKKAPLDLAGVKGAYLALAGLRANGTAAPGHFADLLDQVPSRVEGHQLLPHGVKVKVEANEHVVTIERARVEFGLANWLDPILESERPCAMALLRQPELYRRYLDKVMARHGLKLPPTPPLTITTQHRSKGRESDTVLVCPDMAKASYREYEAGDRESEHRVAYVAATRTKRELRLIVPASPRAYPFLELAKAANA